MGVRGIAFLVVLSTVCGVACAEAIEGDEYSLGPQDVVEIAVWQQPDLTRTCTVTDEGTLFFPPLMEVRVEGMTTSELDEAITQALQREYLKDPEVFVSIKEYNSQKVLLLGHVPKPGLYKLKGKTRLLTLLGDAGGIAVDKVGEKIVIMRAPKGKKAGEGTEDGEHIVVDLQKLLIEGDLRQNIEIRPGDRIFIPGGSVSSVYVLGEVKSPGNYPFQEGLKVFEAIMSAGGPSEDASMSRVRILRGGEKKTIRVNLAVFIKKGRMEENIPLEAGDFVIVPAGIF